MNLMDIINIPMGYVIRFCNNIVGGNYLFALFLFAIIIEIILLPFGIKQQKNSIKQAKLRPKEMAIRKKYAGREDNATKQKISEEIQALYQKEGFSPFSGCLQLIIQFPILIALYNIVLNPLRYICQLSTDTISGLISVVKTFPQYAEAAFTNERTIDLMDAMKNIISENGIGVFNNVKGFSEHITNVTDFPDLSLFGVNLAETPSFTSGASLWLLLVPVLTFVSYYFSMKMTRKLSYQPTTADDKATGCSNKMMDIMMPLMSVYFCFILPAAIGVYWIFKSLLGVLKQFILKKAMPVPVFTEEDYKAAEREYGAKPEKKAKSNTDKGPKPGVRSLHHIDDEDFEDTAPAAAARKKALEEAEQKAALEAPEKPTVIDAAPIKDDARPQRKSKKEKASEEKENENTDNSENN